MTSHEIDSLKMACEMIGVITDGVPDENLELLYYRELASQNSRLVERLLSNLEKAASDYQDLAIRYCRVINQNVLLADKLMAIRTLVLLRNILIDIGSL